MHPGSLELRDGFVRYHLDGAGQWELPLNSIRVIGEVTNNSGPFLDDYFFCFATGPEFWHQASFYAEGREVFLKSLETHLRCHITLLLMGSTDFASNVLWPPHLVGKPMFKFTPVRSSTWLRWLLGGGENKQYFSDEVLTELGTQQSCPQIGPSIE